MNGNFNEWWSIMSTMEHVYWIIAVPSSLVFIMLMLMTFIGGDGDMASSDFEIDADIDGGIPFQFFTIKNLVGFFTIFSWTGLAFIKGGFSVITTIISSSVAGILMMVMMSTIFYLMNKLVESGSIDLKKAIGSMGEVYLVIPGKRKSMGKVQLKVEGAFKTLDAISDEKNDIATGSLVDIIDVTNNDILVVKSSSK